MVRIKEETQRKAGERQRGGANPKQSRLACMAHHILPSPNLFWDQLFNLGEPQGLKDETNTCPGIDDMRVREEFILVIQHSSINYRYSISINGFNQS